MTEPIQTPGPTRRKFLKDAAVAVAVGAGASTLPTAARSATPATSKRYGMVIDVRRCIGCHGCSVACKAEFDVPLGVTRSWVEYVEKGTFPSVSRSFLPRLCNHCNEPPCVYVCPTNATYKRDDGIVVTDDDICIGCKYCIQACPYDARFVNPVTGVADKCDFCQHRVAQGIEPACVETCIGRARIFGDLNDPESEIAKLVATQPVTVLREGQGTQPNVYYIAADTVDEQDLAARGIYVDVITHRRQKARR